MSLLSYTELCDLIDAGVISGVDKTNVNSSSIDLTLGKHIIVEMPAQFPISLRKREQLQSQKVSINKYGYKLMPNQFILAHTQQTFNLPNWLSAEYKLKSSMARIGLEHLTAGWCDAGWHGSSLTLELKNVTEYQIGRAHV